jgi:hypothetical protein
VRGWAVDTRPDGILGVSGSVCGRRDVVYSVRVLCLVRRGRRQPGVLLRCKRRRRNSHGTVPGVLRFVPGCLQCHRDSNGSANLHAHSNADCRTNRGAVAYPEPRSNRCTHGGANVHAHGNADCRTDRGAVACPEPHSNRRADCGADADALWCPDARMQPWQVPGGGRRVRTVRGGSAQHSGGGLSVHRV